MGNMNDNYLGAENCRKRIFEGYQLAGMYISTHWKSKDENWDVLILMQ